MENEEIKSPAPKDGAENSVTVLIVKTAIRTLLSAVVCLALIASLAVTFFPYGAMKFYLDVDMKIRALECAEKYIDGQSEKYETVSPAIDSRYVSALYTAGELSVSLLRGAKNSDARLYYADKIISHTENYLSVNGIHERNAQISEFDVKHQPYYNHPALYSYRDYLVRYNYLARCLTDKRGVMVYDGKPVDMQLIMSAFNNENLTLNGNNIEAFAEVFNQLSEMIEYDFDRAGAAGFASMAEKDLGKIKLDPYGDWFEPLISRSSSIQNTNFTLLLRAMENKFTQFKDYALSMSAATADEALKRLYVFHALWLFGDNLNSALITLSGNEQYKYININDAMRWQKLNTITADGSNYTMRDYYKLVLMPQYAKILASSK